MNTTAQAKIYHIVHIDRLASIIASGGLLCDAQIVANNVAGTNIGMNHIKQRRLKELTLNCYPDLYVGQCVPFYFCPRSIMLYVIHRRGDELAYRGGQDAIVHLQADLHATVQWAQQVQKRWAFTLSNAGSYFFEDRNQLANLGELDWQAINTHQWQGCKDAKQAEFLIEHGFPWQLVECIGVKTPAIAQQVQNILQSTQGHLQRPAVNLQPAWYY